MNSTTFALLVFVGVVSMIAGYLLKYMQDIKHFKEIEDIYEEAMENMASRHKAKEARLLKALAELQMEKAKPMSMRKAVERLYNIPQMDEKVDESIKVFFDLSQQLPDDDSIDFGGF